MARYVGITGLGVSLLVEASSSQVALEICEKFVKRHGTCLDSLHDPETDTEMSVCSSYHGAPGEVFVFLDPFVVKQYIRPKYYLVSQEGHMLSHAEYEEFKRKQRGEETERRWHAEDVARFQAKYIRCPWTGEYERR